MQLYGELIFEQIKSDPNGRLRLMSKGETKTESKKQFTALAFCSVFFSSFSPSNTINSGVDAETINQRRHKTESTHEQLGLSLIWA